MNLSVYAAEIESELHPFPEATPFPLILYRAVLPEAGECAAEFYETLFERNGWPGAWRNGIFHYHHFHPNRHEVLGIAAGQAFVRFQGDSGLLVEVRAGDVVVVPAGVSHCNEGSSADLLVVGSYPDGARPDSLRGTLAEMPAARPRVAKVGVPLADPVFGDSGPLRKHWKA